MTTFVLLLFLGLSVSINIWVFIGNVRRGKRGSQLVETAGAGNRVVRDPGCECEPVFFLERLRRQRQVVRSVTERLERLHPVVPGEVRRQLEIIGQSLTSELNTKEDWGRLLREYRGNFPRFAAFLSKESSQLSFNDIRLLTLIRMDCSVREISELLSISPVSVQKARYRLRRKMGVDSLKDLGGQLQ